MATYYVTPAPDSSQYKWLVQKGNRTKSRHYKKSAAKSSARRMAGDNDSVRMQRADGTFM
jgi:hypothetical protein